MKTSKLLLPIALIFALSMSMISCDDNGNKGNGNSTDSLKTDTIATVKPGDDCVGLKDDQFCSNGFNFIRFGDSVMWVSIPIEGSTERDTVFVDSNGDEEFAWNVKRLEFTDGIILLESDPLNGLYLDRIQVKTPRYSNIHGIHAGSTIKDLKDTYTKLSVWPLERFGVIEIFAEEIPMMRFHIDDPEFSILPLGQEEYDFNALPDTLRLTNIVVLNQMDQLAI